MNWNSYVSRRNINVDQWLQVRGLRDRESFLKILRELAIEAPEESQIDAMFPATLSKLGKGVEDGASNVTSEGSNQAPARSVVGEGDRSSQRTDWKRASKVRN